MSAFSTQDTNNIHFTTFRLTMTTFDQKSDFAFSQMPILVYLPLLTWYEMVAANSYKIPWIWSKIISSNPGQPSRSTFPA